MSDRTGSVQLHRIRVDGGEAESLDVSPEALTQVADGPPLALFGRGLDTEIHWLDPGPLRFRRLSASAGHIDVLTASRSSEVIAALSTTAHEPANVHAGSPGGALSQISDTPGYAVFLPNPRGGTGHGREFQTMVVGAPGGPEWSDILAGIDMLVAVGVADPDRLGIEGASYGGFMAAWAVGQTDRFKAAMMLAGICDWGVLAGTGEYGSMDGVLAGSFGWEGTGPHPHDRVSPIS